MISRPSETTANWSRWSLFSPVRRIPWATSGTFPTVSFPFAVRVTVTTLRSSAERVRAT